MCLQCLAGRDGHDVARRAHVLRLLALVEQPGALPADASLRIAREILALSEAERGAVRCDPVTSTSAPTIRPDRRRP